MKKAFILTFLLIISISLVVSLIFFPRFIAQRIDIADTKESFSFLGDQGIIKAKKICLNDECLEDWSNFSSSKADIKISDGESGEEVIPDNIFYKDGNLGLGAKNPEATLDIESNNENAININFVNSDDKLARGINFLSEGENKGNIGLNPCNVIDGSLGICSSSADSSIIFGSKNVPYMTLKNRSVGIGTVNPNNSLHIYRESGTDNAEINIQSIAGSDNHWSIYHDRTSKDMIWWHKDAGDGLVLTNEGNLGIGIKYPEVRLEVGGNMKVKGNIESYNGVFNNSLLASNLVINNDALVGGGLMLGYTDVCNNGMLRYNKDKLEYCRDGFWEEIVSDKKTISGDNPASVAWDKESNGNLECARAGYGACVSVTDSEGNKKSCSWLSSYYTDNLSAVCGTANKGVTWDGYSNGNFQCASSGYGVCIRSYDSRGNVKPCNWNTSSDMKNLSAICDMTSEGVAWNGESNGNLECAKSGHGECIQVYDDLGLPKSCKWRSNSEQSSLSAICSLEGVGVIWNNKSSGNFQCVSSGYESCLKVYDENGDEKECDWLSQENSKNSSAVCIK